MQWSKQRTALRGILTGNVCIRPGSVYDAVSARIAEDLGFELGMLGGSTASLTVLGDPDLMLITLSELAETVHRIARAGSLPLLVDADHGFGNALNVRRTVQELESAGAAGLTIEDTLLPTPYGQAKPQLISLEEGVGKMKAAVDARVDPNLSIFARTGANITSIDDAVTRAKAYETTGVDALVLHRHPHARRIGEGEGGDKTADHARHHRARARRHSLSDLDGRAHRQPGPHPVRGRFAGGL